MPGTREAPRPKGGASLKPTTWASVPPPRSGLPFIPMQSKGLSGRFSKIMETHIGQEPHLEPFEDPALLKEWPMGPACN
jgi:hypothetical protein